jgi:hypothetical protein
MSRFVGSGHRGEWLALGLARRSLSGAGAAASSASVLAPAGQERLAGDRKAPRSAFTIFREQVIMRDQGLGRRPRVANKQYWDYLKAAWRALEPERKQAYQDEAASERDLILAGRKRRRLAAHSAPPAANQVELPQLQDSVAVSSPPLRAQGGLRSTVYINQALETSRAHSELAAPSMPSLSQDSMSSRHPLPEPLFAEYLKRAHGRTLQSCSGFKEKCQKMQGGSDFPKKVRYHSRCGAVCSQSAGEANATFHGKIKAFIATYVNKNFKTPADVAVSDVLFAIEVSGKALADGSEATSVTFAAMTVAAGRRAHLEAEQTFVPCRVVSGVGTAPYKGFLLEYFADKVEAKGKAPTQRVRDDRMLRQHDADDLVAALLANGHFSDIDCLVWRRLTWKPQYDSEDGGLHRLRVVGAHASEPMSIERCTGIKQLVDQGAVNDQGDADGDIDFLEMLERTGPRLHQVPTNRAGDDVIANLLGRDFQLLLDEAGPRVLELS